MITFPIAKVNLGLNIVERRADGYHNLQTVFYPVPLTDALEVNEMHHAFPLTADCDIKVSGIALDGPEEQNLVVRAYRMLKNDFPTLPRLHVHLHKNIPSQAGMGGGSSDGTAMLLLLNRCYGLGLSQEQLIQRAKRLGADCPFFVMNSPAYAEGIGERLKPISLKLSGWHMAIVRPDINIPTKEAFALIEPRQPRENCLDIVSQPVETWREKLTNDFEKSVFAQHPLLANIKDSLYQQGAVYAAMSGSGSSIFGLFSQPVDLKAHFPDMFTACIKL